MSAPVSPDFERRSEARELIDAPGLAPAELAEWKQRAERGADN